jgi:hypothetical protein
MTTGLAIDPVMERELSLVCKINFAMLGQGRIACFGHEPKFLKSDR